MKWAVYSLQQNSPSFDCLTFVQVAKTNGADGVWILEGKSGWGGYGGSEGEEKRVETIIKPIMELSGLEYIFSSKPPKESVWGGNSSHKMVNATNLNKVFPLQPTQRALDKVWDKFGGRKRIVLSTRQCNYQERRNTGDGHFQWAKEVDAIVIPDDLSVSLDERVAHHELAEVTVGVGGGHLMPAVFSYRPYLLVKQIIEEYKATRLAYFQDNNMPKGYQFPWSTKKQKIDWDRGDSYEDTCKAFEAYLKGA